MGVQAHILESLPNTHQIDEGCFIRYDSKPMLLQLIDRLKSLAGSNMLACTLVNQLEKPLFVYPFIEIAERIEKNEIVQIIQSTDFNGYFQPIVSLKDNHLFAYESLLLDPLGRISPGELFQVAQDTGMHSLLDQKARETAIRSRQGKVRHGIKSFINFLPSTIYNPEYCLKHTFSIVERYGILPGDLVFEVVETEKIADIDHLKKIFQTYKRQGMQVALDDFGAGFSTFDVLHELQPDYVKIDRSHIMNCDQDEAKQEFLKNLVQQAGQIGTLTLAEGVEREEEHQFCKEIGIDLAQGYYYGKPESEPSFDEKAVKNR
ncbi:EAL domain-containing protein [Bacillus sp. V59.32b]|nr:EAL domain-containing protein [Bacillus sp. V59.32b]